MNNIVFEDIEQKMSAELPFLFTHNIISTHKPYEPHWHNCIELIYFISGTGNVAFLDLNFDVQAGSFIVVSPHRIHSVKSNTELSFYSLVISEQFLKENGFDLKIRSFIPEPEIDNIADMFKRIADNIDNPDGVNIARVRIDVLELFYDVYYNHTNPRSAPRDNFKDFNKVIQYIYENYNRDISLDEISAYANVSKFYFTKKFKSLTGTSFITFLNTRRCRNAETLLQNGVSVDEACYKSGFHDKAFFTKTFKKIIGRLPSEVKQKAEP